MEVEGRISGYLWECPACGTRNWSQALGADACPNCYAKVVVKPPEPKGALKGMVSAPSAEREGERAEGRVSAAVEIPGSGRVVQDCNAKGLGHKFGEGLVCVECGASFR